MFSHVVVSVLNVIFIEYRYMYMHVGNSNNNWPSLVHLDAFSIVLLLYCQNLYLQLVAELRRNQRLRLDGSI